MFAISYFVIGDSAFSSEAMADKLRCCLSKKNRRYLHQDAPPHDIPAEHLHLHRAIVSVRQAVEWGMGAVSISLLNSQNFSRIISLVPTSWSRDVNFMLKVLQELLLSLPTTPSLVTGAEGLPASCSSAPQQPREICENPHHHFSSIQFTDSQDGEGQSNRHDFRS